MGPYSWNAQAPIPPQQAVQPIPTIGSGWNTMGQYGPGSGLMDPMYSPGGPGAQGMMAPPPGMGVGVTVGAPNPLVPSVMGNIPGMAPGTGYGGAAGIAGATGVNPMAAFGQPNSAVNAASYEAMTGGPTGGSPPAASNWFDDMVGTTGKPGWGGLALGAAQGLTGAYLGMQQLDLAKKTLSQNKQQFEMNYGAQRQTLNTRLEDRQRARSSATPGTETVESYMERNRIR